MNNSRIFSFGQVAITCFLFLGLFFRASHYASNRSLWMDEAFVGVDVCELSWKEILFYESVYPFQQKQSLGFFLMEKISVSLLGMQESALRLFPFLSGITVLFLFTKYLRAQGKSRVQQIFSLGLLSVSPSLIYYSGEVRQYSSDALWAVVLFFLFDYILKNREQARAFYWAGFWGLLAMWFSNAMLFVLAGFWAALFLRFVCE